LSRRFDVIILPSGVGPSTAASGRAAGDGEPPAAGPGVPDEYEPTTGAYSAATTVPQLKKFLEDGGTILAVGRSGANLAQLFDLPVGNHLVERLPDGGVRRLPAEKYYVPGSILQVAVDNTAPLAQGLEKQLDVFFDNSPVFTLRPDAALKGVRAVAWFNSASSLRSGWAFGQGYLDGGVQVVDAQVGKGRLFMFAPEITFRAQPHGTFKFLFNGLYLAARDDYPRAPTSTPR
jgi:hypothetical protein